jgi:Winged helix DNA-binding domain
MQDSMPRAALLSIHAQVEGTGPSTWEDASLVHLRGPRFNVFVVAAAGRAVFSLGTLPGDAKGRRRAEDLAARLHAILGRAPMTCGQAGRALGVHPNSFRYAAATGTVLIRWDGARQPAICTVPPPQADPRDARLELARRYLHIYGPATPEAFGGWAGIGRRHGVEAFEALGRSLTPVETPVGDAWILTQDEATFRPAAAPWRLRGAAKRRRLSPALRRWPPRRGRDRRDLAARGHGDHGAALAAAVTRRARCGRGRSGVLAATRHRRAADRRPLG